jgi:hypothetical protein
MTRAIVSGHDVEVRQHATRAIVPASFRENPSWVAFRRSMARLLEALDPELRLAARRALNIRRQGRGSRQSIDSLLLKMPAHCISRVPGETGERIGRCAASE